MSRQTANGSDVSGRKEFDGVGKKKKIGRVSQQKKGRSPGNRGQWRDGTLCKGLSKKPPGRKAKGASLREALKKISSILQKRVLRKENRLTSKIQHQWRNSMAKRRERI